ncbi:dCTP deaminase [Oceanobacillus timonensis]|uniref:dCTP deaminase n=1 Tax=Oceanobacillus timonensis TaxID=1926285 RepID=UPI0009B99EBD|nr:dCTP deaminase [Oceanobacillus timonensis]
MLLSDKDLRELAVKHELVTPFLEQNCEGATIDLTLDSQIKKQKSNINHIIVNRVSDSDYEVFDINKEDFILEPNESVLVQSIEYFKIPNNMAGIIFERYSIKLKGLVVSPASYMNPGYEGRLSFLLTNNSNGTIQLVSGVKFCQLSIASLSSESEFPYRKQDAKYMGSEDVQLSKLHLDQEIQNYFRDSGVRELSGDEASQMGLNLMDNIKSNAKKYAEIIKENLGDNNGESSAT